MKYNVQKDRVVARALKVLAEVEPLIRETRQCLEGPQPGFPVYAGDIQRCGIALSLLAAQHTTLLELEAIALRRGKESTPKRTKRRKAPR